MVPVTLDPATLHTGLHEAPAAKLVHELGTVTLYLSALGTTGVPEQTLVTGGGVTESPGTPAVAHYILYTYKEKHTYCLIIETLLIMKDHTLGVIEENT